MIGIVKQSLLLVTVLMLIWSAEADPVFECLNNATNKKSITDYNGYRSCKDCRCGVFEHMCLYKVSDTYRLLLRSLAFENSCSPPKCICNSEASWETTGYSYLNKEYQPGRRATVLLPSFEELTSSLPGSYEYNLVKEFQLPSDDSRGFTHPFVEETTGKDLLRMVLHGNFTWSSFMEGCDSDSADDSELRCDLYYEKSWTYRREYTTKCKFTSGTTNPCTGSHACLCKHGEKDFYQVSKTMPVIPKNYTGIATALNDVWIEPEVILPPEEGLTVVEIVIIVACVVGGLLLMCCCGYYIVIACANRQHKVSYDVDKTPQTMSKTRTKKKQPVPPAVQLAKTDDEESASKNSASRRSERSVREPKKSQDDSLVGPSTRPPKSAGGFPDSSSAESRGGR